MDLKRQYHELSNAVHLSVSCRPVIPLILLRYQAIAEFLTEEPPFVYVKLKPDDEEKDLLEQVLRIRRWIDGTSLYSWCLYAKERDVYTEEDNGPGIVVRHASWDWKGDITNLRTLGQEALLDRWPTITARNYFLFRSDFDDPFIELIAEFDRRIKSECLSFTPSTEHEETVEILRIFDWGKINFTWNCTTVSHPLKELLTRLENRFTSLHSTSRPAEIELDFSIDPQYYSSNVRGEATDAKQP